MVCRRQTSPATSETYPIDSVLIYGAIVSGVLRGWWAHAIAMSRSKELQYARMVRGEHEGAWRLSESASQVVGCFLVVHDVTLYGDVEA